jgi:hypothetical protein
VHVQGRPEKTMSLHYRLTLGTEMDYRDGSQWLTPVIPTTQEAVIRRIAV